MITPELLKSFSPCKEGYRRFIELFPEGATLDVAISGLCDDGHDSWGEWLFDKCRENNLFQEVTSKGYRNTGDRNTGSRNTGDRNTGDWNTGDWNTGDRNTGSRNTGYMNTGDWNTGDWNTGNRNTGDRNTGGRNTGDRNTGSRNTGSRNTGNRNTGDWNTGDWNTGNRNTGDWNTGGRNTGDRNTGSRNTGSRNTGNRNTGDWNTGDWNTGFFNTVTPDVILAFNKECPRDEWEKAYKPNFLFFDLTYWVEESEMTDEEKTLDPGSHYRGGQLRKKDYKAAFKEAWDNADPDDREKIKNLPNFDPQIFFEISGIDLREKD